MVGLFLLRSISFQFCITWNFLTEERDLGTHSHRLGNCCVLFSSITFILFPFFSICVFSCLNENKFYGVVLECCWQCCVRGDTGRLSDAFTCLMSISPKVLLHFQTPLVQQYPLCLNGHDSKKTSRAVVWPCTTFFFSPIMRKRCSPACMRGFWIWGRNVLLFECCNSHFQWQF